MEKITDKHFVVRFYSRRGGLDFPCWSLALFCRYGQQASSPVHIGIGAASGGKEGLVRQPAWLESFGSITARHNIDIDACTAYGSISYGVSISASAIIYNPALSDQVFDRTMRLVRGDDRRSGEQAELA